jgi:hypothetical protein
MSLTILLALCTQIEAQSYNGVFGLKFGNDVGVSYQQRLFKNYTLQLEHQDGLFTNIKQTSIMVKKHHGILTRRINVFLGGGLMTSQRINTNVENPSLINSNRALVMAVGGELTFGKINLTYDVNPGMTFGPLNNQTRLFSSSSIGVRYVIWGRKSQTKEFFEKLAFWRKK